MIVNKYLRCNSTKTQDPIIKCTSAVKLRKKCIKYMMIGLVKNKLMKVLVDNMFTIREKNFEILRG